MRRTTTLAAALVTTLALGLLPSAATADPPAPHVTDPAGDANGLNAQGNASAPAGGPDTKPASIDGADIREVSFETRYSTTKVYNPDGTVARVLYTANALKVNVTMEGNVLPTFGPSLLLRVPTRVTMPNGSLCESWFQAWWRGPRALPNDLERADIRRLTGGTPSVCPAVNTITAGFDLVVDGKVVTMIYPLNAPGMAGYIQEGTLIKDPPVFINGSSYIHTRVAFIGPSQTVGLPPPVGTVTVNPGVFPLAIDEAARFTAFTVGSDVPANIDCAVTPDAPECQTP